MKSGSGQGGCGCRDRAEEMENKINPPKMVCEWLVGCSLLRNVVPLLVYFDRILDVI